MAPKSPLWQQFYSNKTKYKTDRTHFNAWCRACLDVQIRIRKDSDGTAIAAGIISAARTDSELFEDGKCLAM